MESIRIQGLRSLEDSGFVEIKPLTLLLGENSSGKSTFLRTFPLLRQSTAAATIGPILWYGDYVDFGSFDDALSKFKKKRLISLSFRLDSKKIIRALPGTYSHNAGLKEGILEVKLDLSDDGKQGTTRVCSVEIKHNTNSAKISYKQNNKIASVVINDLDLTEFFLIHSYSQVGTTIH